MLTVLRQTQTKQLDYVVNPWYCRDSLFFVVSRLPLLAWCSHSETQSREPVNVDITTYRLVYNDNITKFIGNQWSSDFNYHCNCQTGKQWPCHWYTRILSRKRVSMTWVWLYCCKSDTNQIETYFFNGLKISYFYKLLICSEKLLAKLVHQKRNKKFSANKRGPFLV